MSTTTAKPATAIAEMDRSELLEQWAMRFGGAAPKHISLKLLRMVLAWEVQAAIEGGLSREAERFLRDRARQLRERKQAVTQRSEAEQGDQGMERASSSRPAPLLRPGIQLMREWNGRTYRVEVTGTGFAMDGRTYRSLTAIAKRITGAHWSGPRFFGLIERGPERLKAAAEKSGRGIPLNRSGSGVRPASCSTRHCRPPWRDQRHEKDSLCHLHPQIVRGGS